MSQLCLMTVHAHPDDESSKGAGTVAKYHAEGVHTVLVCCTGGEEGDILNPAMDRPGVREDITSIRSEELDRAAKIIGYDDVEKLGYRDSGMPDSEANADPRSFARAPLDEAVGRLVALIRKHRPQVVVTYPENQSGYPHPDHIRDHEVTTAAFAAAGDPKQYPEAGKPWAPVKLYWVVWSARRMQAMQEKYDELGLESPYSDERLKKAIEHSEIDKSTTLIEIRHWERVSGEALRAHQTQVDPNGRWFSLPQEASEGVWPYDEYVLAVDHTGRPYPEPDEETDLFAGVRELVSR